MGGQKDFAKKKFPALILGEKILRPEGPAKKFLRLALGSVLHSEACFRTPKPVFALQIRLSQSEICFPNQNLLFALRKLFHPHKNQMVVPQVQLLTHPSRTGWP